MKVYGGNGCIDTCFLDLSTFMPRLLRSWYPFDRRLGGPQNLSGLHGEVNILAPHWDSNYEPSVVQPVASCYTSYTMQILPNVTRGFKSRFLIWLRHVASMGKTIMHTEFEWKTSLWRPCIDDIIILK
jgi:hypothetical protein